MAEKLEPPLVAAVVASLLRTNLSEAVVTRIPESRPPRFIRILATGGSGRTSTALHRATVVVESWDNDYEQAALLASSVDAEMFAAVDAGVGIKSVTSNSAPADFPDTLSGQSRFTATYEVTVKVATA